MADRSRARGASSKGSIHTQPLTAPEGAILDYLREFGFRQASDLRPYAALGSLVARGMVEAVDGEARLSVRGQIAAAQRRDGTGWSSPAPRRDKSAPRGASRSTAQRGKRAAASGPRPRYLLNGEPLQGGLAGLFRDNDFDREEREIMRGLQPGDTYRGGGGAWAEWEVKRIA